MYTIRRAGNQGIGVFATKHILPGARILAEKPFVTVKSETDAYAAIRRTLADDNDRAWLNSLTASGRPQNSLLDQLAAAWHVARSGIFPSQCAVNEYNAVLPKFRNNNFDIGDGNQAMFREITRLNHSCLPNSQGNFNDGIGMFTVHALRPIRPEEEITISYLGSHMALAELRRIELRKRYGFECHCPLCDLRTATARKREQKRLSWFRKTRKNIELGSLSGKKSPKAELELIEEMIEIFVEEENRGQELATMFGAAAEMHGKLGNEEEFLRFVNLSLTTDLFCLGEDNPLYLENVKRQDHLHRILFKEGNS